MWIAEKFQSNPDIAGSPEIALGLALYIFTGGKALNSLGAERLPKLIKLRIPDKVSTGVRLREISLVVKRETAQTHS